MTIMRTHHDPNAIGAMAAHPVETATVRRVPVFMIVAAALMMTSLDSTIVATALDTLQRDLGASINWVGWTITAYAFGLLLMLPISGALSQRHGHRRVFVVSVVVFAGASALCGMAGNIYTLVALRAVQAAGGAGFTPSVTAIIVAYFGKERDRAVSLFGSIFAIGAMIGPVFGGLFVTYWSWRGIFWINVPISAVVIALTLHFVPRDPPRPPQARVRTDLSGMAVLGLGLLAGMFAVSYLGEGTARIWSPAFALPLVVAVVGLWLFFRHINRSPYPFIRPDVIHGPGFGAVNLLNVLYSGIPIGLVALVPLYAANRYGIGALAAGTLLVTEGAASILLSVGGTLALRRTGYRLPIYAGTVVAAVGVLLLAVDPPTGISAYAWLAGAAALVGAGTGVVSPASRNAGLQLAPERSATIAGVRTMCINIGAITTVDVITAILADSHDTGVAQGWVYLVVGLVLVATLPVVSRVPEHHGSW